MIRVVVVSVGVSLSVLLSVSGTVLQALIAALLLGETQGTGISVGHLVAAITALFAANASLIGFVGKMLLRQIDRLTAERDEWKRRYLEATGSEDSKL